MAAVNAISGIRTVLVDTTFAAATVPSGTWAADNVQFYGKVPSSGLSPTLTFQNGAQLTANYIYAENLILSSVSTSPVMTFSGGVGCSISLRDSAVFASASAPFFRAATDSGSVNIFALGVTELGDATNPVIQSDGAANVFLSILDQTILFANATTGTGTVSLTFVPASDAGGLIIDALVQFPQLAGLSPTNLMPTVPIQQNELFLANLLVPSTMQAVSTLQTSNATPIDMPGAGFGDATVSMPNHTGGRVELVVVARIPSTDQMVMWHAEAAFKNSGGTISVGALLNVGGNALSSFGPTAGDTAAFAGATVGMDVVPANPNAKGIQPQVTGLPGVTINWTIKATYFYTHS